MLTIKNITKTYDNTIIALNSISLDFLNYGMYAIVGKSGSGKSTLLNCISLLENIDEGSIYYNDIKLNGLNENEKDKYRAKLFSFIFQEFNLIEELTVFENLQIVCDDNNDQIDKVLVKVNLTDLKNTEVKKLSGGEKQRVAIARALLKNTKIILADEPTGNLDENTGTKIMDLLKEISKDHLVILVTHNMKFAEMYADRLIKLDNGNLIEHKIVNKTNEYANDFNINLNNKINKKLRQKLYKDELKKNFKRIRGLLITIIFSLLLLSLSITLYTNKPVNIIQDNIVNFGYNLFEIGTYEENNKYYTNYVYFSEDYEKLLKNNVKVYPYLKSNNTLVKYNDDFNLKYLNIIFVDEFNFLFSLIYGNYPENDFEIIISDYVAEVLLKAHYYSNVKVATDLIGLTYTTQSNNFKIVGIYDTKYEKYIDNKNSLESEFFKFRDNYISAFASNISTFYQITNSINYVDTMLNSPFINIININEESKNKILYQIDSKNGLFVTTNYLKNLGYNIDSILNNPQGVYDDIDKELSLDTIWGRKTYNIIGIYDNENEESINMEIASIACYSENIWDLTANVGLVLDVTKANALDKCWNLNYNVMTKNIGIFKTIETIYNYSKNIVLVIGLVFFIIYIILFSSYVLFTIEDRRYFIGVLRSVGISKQNINRFFINNNIVISLLILLLSFIINFPLIKLSNKMLLINSSFNIILYQFNVFILVILMIFVLCINMLISFLAINKLNKKPIVSIVRNI